MSYANRILEQWKNFDAFLSGIEGNKKLHWCVYTIRNLYVANQEIGVRGTDIGSLLTSVLHAFKMLVFSLVKKPLLRGAVAGPVLLEIQPEKDEELAKSINLSLGRIVHVADMRLRNIRRLDFIAIWLTASWLLLRSPLNKTVIIKCLPDMLLGLYVYHLLDLNGVRIIVTQRDRYPVELAVLRKTREMNARSIRIEDFMSLGAVNRNTIFSDYYFCPNPINKAIFQSFPENKSVIFVDGGFPYWDRLAQIPYSPDNNPKLILFMTQYGTDLGIFGEKGPSFYIEEIISILPEGYNLFIKPHPLDNVDTYRKYLSSHVRITMPGEIDNVILFSRSSHVFSIASQATVESKHICPNSYFINYDPDGLSDMKYDLLTAHIDMISNKEDLIAFLNNRKAPMSQQRFIEYFNPTYPNTSSRLRELVDSLI